MFNESIIRQEIEGVRGMFENQSRGIVRIESNCTLGGKVH